MIKEKKSIIIGKKWPFFLLGVLVVSMVTSIGVATHCQPRNDERIYVFAPVYDCDTSAFVNECKKGADETIREVSIKHGIPGKDDTYRIFGAYYDSVDFYILPFSWVTKINSISAHYTKEKINELIPNSSDKALLHDDKNFYGIKVYDAATDSGSMKSIFTYTAEGVEQEDYYLIFREASIHIKGLSKSGSDNALKIANHLLTI